MTSSIRITDFPDMTLVYVWFKTNPRRDGFHGAKRWPRPALIDYRGNGVVHPGGGMLGAGWIRLTRAA